MADTRGRPAPDLTDLELLREAYELLTSARYRNTDPALHRRWSRRRREVMDAIRPRVEGLASDG
jgi:hypothetical protein